jgi:aspartate aminotransferase
MTLLSKRLKGLEESVTLAITAKAKAMAAEGRSVIGLGAGEPDFDTPENIKGAAIEAIKKGHTKYTPVGGINELKDAIINKFKRDNGASYSRDEVIVSSGGKHSIFNLLMSILDNGDEVIIPSPYWVSYPAMVGLAGGVPVIAGTREGEGFKMTPEQFSSLVTKKTKAVIINSPSNPTGAAYDRGELEGLALVALKNNVLIISDEIYEKLCYGGFQQTSVASISNEVRANTVVLNGVSKAYSMTGWRIGYAGGPAHIIKAMTSIQSQSTSNPSSISQWASVEALNGPQGAVEEMRREFEKRRDEMVSGLKSIEGIKAGLPKGAFYVFANTKAIYGRRHKETGIGINNSVDLAGFLLENSGVAVVPGSPFGDDAYVRLSYATSMDKIREGIKRIRDAVGGLV